MIYIFPTAKDTWQRMVAWFSKVCSCSKKCPDGEVTRMTIKMTTNFHVQRHELVSEVKGNSNKPVPKEYIHPTKSKNR